MERYIQRFRLPDRLFCSGAPVVLAPAEGSGL